MIKRIAIGSICLLFVLLVSNLFGTGIVQATPVANTPISENNNNIEILGIDPTAYPKIKVNIFVDELCAATGNLVKDEFTVEEDGNEVSIDNFYFTGKAMGQKLDLAVVFDETDTMADEIDTMQSKVDELTNKIKASNIDARYSLVTFKTEISTRIEWTHDTEGFKREVGRLSASGGNYQRPEDSLGGVATALSFGFRPDAQKIVIVITDEPSMQRGDGWSNSTYQADDVLRDLSNAGAMLVAVSPDFRSGTIPSNIPQSDLPLYADMRELAQSSGGLWIDINSADFSVILDQLENIITGTYVIEYTSSNLTPTSTKDVSVSVIAPEFTEYEAISSYTVPADVTSPNDPPVISDLTADKTSPQQPGSVITWIVDAADPNDDQVLYRFFLDDEPMTNWKVDNSWTWTAPAEEGTYRIEAQVRDGKHALPNRMDDRRAVSFQITSPTVWWLREDVEPDNQPSVINDLNAEQNSAKEIIWTATAIDQDGDQILYRFYLNNRSMTEWIADNKWTLNTAEAAVGENRVAVEIRDGKHSDPDGYDDAEFVQFELSSMKLIVQKGVITLGEGGQAESVQQTSDGGYVVAGNSRPGYEGNPAWLVKVDANGNLLWDRIFDGSEAYEVQQTNDGGYVIVGHKGDQGWLMKTDADGNKLWDRTYGKLNRVNDVFKSVKQTNDGGYILAGYTDVGTLELNIDFWLIKTDASGNEVWSRTFGGSDPSDWAYCVQQTDDGGYILVGYARSYSIGSDETYRATWLIKTNSLGYKEWDKLLPGDSCDSVAQTSDGGYIVGGGIFSSLIKTDSMGNIEWTKFSNSLFSTSGVQQTSDGGYITAGFIPGSDTGGIYSLIKTDSRGNEEWRKLLPDAIWNSIKQTSDGGYIIAGYNRNAALLIKTDSHGNF